MEDFEEIFGKIQRLSSLDGQTVDPKEVMSPMFNEVFQTKKEAFRDSQIRDYKKGKKVQVSKDEEDYFLDGIIDDLLDNI